MRYLVFYMSIQWGSPQALLGALTFWIPDVPPPLDSSYLRRGDVAPESSQDASASGALAGIWCCTKPLRGGLSNTGYPYVI
jgi:hypothetical protein